MKKGLTELVFILDRSGSMCGLESDTIGGFNAMLEKQKAVEGEAHITTVLFDHRYELLHDRLDIKTVGPITDKEYFVGGTTALLDAIGRTVNTIDRGQKQADEESRAEKVMFVIITDGYENASREYSYEKVKALISRKKEESGWEFIFLGANIDAVATAGRFGIAPDRAQNYHADKAGVELNFNVMAKAVTSYRSKSKIPENWNEEIQADFEQRDGS